MEKSQIVMHEDIKHIRDRIDNGLSVTITKVYDTMNIIAPQVKSNTKWACRFENALYWIAIIGVIGGSIGVAYGFLK